MKIRIDDEVIFEVTDLHKKSIAYFINKNEMVAQIKESIKWNIQSYCENPMENLKKEWMPIFFKRLKQIPTDNEELLNLIFSQPDYKDKYLKDCLEKAQKEATFKVD